MPISDEIAISCVPLTSHTPTGMTAHRRIQRKKQTGEPTNNVGEFGSFTKDPPASSLTDVLARANTVDAMPPHVARETLSSIRGHAFFPDDVSEWPRLGDLDDEDFIDKPVIATYKTTDCQWYVMEFEPTTGEAYGCVVDQGRAHEANFIMQDLEAHKSFDFRHAEGFLSIVSRDTDFRGPVALNRILSDDARL